MRITRLLPALALPTLALLLAAAPALAEGNRAPAEVDGKKGVGYARSIGGTSGLAFNYGLTAHLLAEGLLGIRYVAYESEEVDPEFWLDLGVGAHFQILQAEQAAFSAGGRVNVMTGPAGEDSDGAPVDVTQFGVDIPLRVWWWPGEHISLHVETGIAFMFGPDDGVVTSDGRLVPKGMVIAIFDNFGTDLFGHIGLTFWW